jgi:hypothetical protein
MNRSLRLNQELATNLDGARGLDRDYGGEVGKASFLEDSHEGIR